MKSHKGEGIKLNQGKGGVGSGDREPLFPRLHVNETEKAGPKAPPRNKMALYEQFTVPSQHFQPAQGSTSTVLRQPYGSGYHCIPYLIPSVAYGSANNVQAYAQPSQVTNSSGITKGSIVVNEDSRKAPRHHKSSSSSPGKLFRVLTEASTECITTDAQEQKGSLKVSMKKTINEGTSLLKNVPMCKERPDISMKTESSHEVVSTLKDDMESIHQRNNGFPKSAISNCQSGYFPARLELSEGTSKMNTVLPKLQTLILSSNHSSTAKSSRCDGDSLEQHEMASELGNSERKDAILNGECKDQLSAKDQGLSSEIVSDERSRICSSELQYSPNVKKADNNKEADHVDADAEGFVDLKREEINPEVSHHTGEPRYDGDDFPLLLKPKDVIFAIGQQQFWKARKMLLRQQKIFSDQVFQLHKLIMTQQLLAQTPGTLIDEAVHVETNEDCHAPTPAPPAKGAAKPNCCDSDERCSRKESKSQACDADPQPLSKEGENEVKVGIAESTHGKVSAWGYPTLGPWLCPAGIQGQPYGYPQMNGAMPLGSVFGLPYGSTLPGSPSPMVSFGIPFCGQQQEVLAEIGSNYGTGAVSKLGASGRKSHNLGLFPNEFASSWYLMQHSSLNQHRMHCSGSGKDASTGSGASVNKASPSAAQGGKGSCFPGLLQNWSISSQAGGASNTEGFDSSGPQSEISSPSIATKLACTASPLTSSTRATKKLGLKEDRATGHNYNVVNLNRSQSCDSRRSSAPSGEEEEEDARASSKALKESCCSLADDGAVEHSTWVGGNALELFPLVPSLSSFGQNCEQDSNIVKIGQGSVIRAVPRRAIAASESTAGILLALQRERRK